MSDIKRVNVNSTKATINPDYDAKLNHTDASLFTAETLQSIAGYNPTNGINMQNAVDVLAKKQVITPYVKNNYSNSDLDIKDKNGYILAKFNQGHIQTKEFDSYVIKSSVNRLENAINSSTIQVVDSKFEGDLYIEDDSHNMLVTFENGHIQTKNFDSNKIVKTINSSLYYGDLYIEDESGNAIIALSNGHIKTKNFDSAHIDLSEYAKKTDIPEIPDYFKVSRFSGKRLAIIGDSISTYSGTMPSGYAVYYPKGNVNSVDKMWWAKVCQKLGMTYVNTSWSGSRVSGEPKGSTAYAACSDKRIQDVGRNGTPDIIICYISCNDWGNDIAIGTWQTSDPIDQNISTTISELRYAYALMLYKLSKSYPRARIFCCSNLDDTQRDRVSGWPSNNNNGVSTYEWNKNVKEVAEALGAVFVDLHACGINYANILNFVVDSGLHPNAEGHQIMADYITAQIIANY